MLNRASRLPSAEFRSGKYRTVATPYFVLKAKGNQRSRNRVGIVIGGAVHKNAVRRNFWKRQAKAELAGLEGLPRDFLIIFSPKVNTITKKQFKTMLTEAINHF